MDHKHVGQRAYDTVIQGGVDLVRPRGLPEQDVSIGVVVQCEETKSDEIEDWHSTAEYPAKVQIHESCCVLFGDWEWWFRQHPFGLDMELAILDLSIDLFFFDIINRYGY